jgi:hypothetical protein
LTPDIWHGDSKEYFSVVFHFVTDGWELDKCFVGMRSMDYAHTHVNIVEHILQVISEYNMVSNVFSITLDNAFVNTSDVTELTHHLLPYVGSKTGSSGGLPLSPSRSCHIIFLSLSWPPALQEQHAPAYSIQPTTTSASTTSAFSHPVNTTIEDLTISEFIL